MVFLLCRREVQHGYGVFIRIVACVRISRFPAKRSIMALLLDGVLRCQGCIPSGNREIGGALEHGEMRRPLGDNRNRLNTRRPGANDGDSLARKIHAFGWPVGCMEYAASKILQSCQVGRLWNRQTACCHDEEACAESAPVACIDDPARTLFIETRGYDPSIEKD